MKKLTCNKLGGNVCRHFSSWFFDGRPKVEQSGICELREAKETFIKYVENKSYRKICFCFLFFPISFVKIEVKMLKKNIKLKPYEEKSWEWPNFIGGNLKFQKERGF